MLKIDEYIVEKTKIIDARLKELFFVNKKLPQYELFEAANYSIFSGGKRLRPLLLLATVDTFHGNTSDAIDIACAIESIHTYSLIHDDLPCMDNDDFRRNKPSLHKAFSESTALLTGDFLLTYAFELISQSKNLPESKKNTIISIITKSIGAHGMIGGQFVDLKSENRMIDWNTLKFMHGNKTAALFVACLQSGGIIANANESEINALINYGENIGLAYQLVDDILDASPEKNIKATSDQKKDKATAITVLGLKKTEELIKELYEKGIMSLSILSYPPPLLKDLAYKLIKRAV